MPCHCETLDTEAARRLRVVSEGLTSRTDDMVLRDEYGARIAEQSPCGCTVRQIMDRYSPPRYRSAF